jgi:hypothetical protein
VLPCAAVEEIANARRAAASLFIVRIHFPACVARSDR